MTLSQRVGPPRGQGLLELAVAVAVLLAVLTALTAVGIVGDVSMRTMAATRYAAFDCDGRPGHCLRDAVQPQQRVRAQILGDADQPALVRPRLRLPEYAGSYRLEGALRSESAIRLSTDIARVDGSDQSLMQRLGTVFRDFGQRAGPALFDLPSPNHLIRSSVTTTLWATPHPTPSRSWVPRIDVRARLALVSDSWAALDTAQFTARVQEGSSPSDLLRQGVVAMYLPAKDVLMPVMEVLGLDAGTSSFREAFHQVATDIPLAGTRLMPDSGGYRAH